LFGLVGIHYWAGQRRCSCFEQARTGQEKEKVKEDFSSFFLVNETRLDLYQYGKKKPRLQLVVGVLARLNHTSPACDGAALKMPTPPSRSEASDLAIFNFVMEFSFVN